MAAIHCRTDRRSGKAERKETEGIRQKAVGNKKCAICWDRGRPARNEREARKWIRSNLRMTARRRRVCGRDARGPSKSLERYCLPCLGRRELSRRLIVY